MRSSRNAECLSMPMQASSIPASSFRIALLAAFACSLLLAAPAHGAGTQGTQSRPMMDQKGMMDEKGMSGMMREERQPMTPEQRAQRVETRIKTLHDKLRITPEQEARWNDVAQTMRDNQAAVSSLIEARRQNAQGMNAIDDLRSYQAITQAHADGMNRMIGAFQALYDEMPAEQKKVADDVFGRFEGHRGGMMRDGKGTTTRPRR